MITSIYSKMRIAMVCAMASMGSLCMQAQEDEQFIKNDIVSNGVVTERIIYVENDGQLIRRRHYRFGYDEQQRVQTKEAEKWDSESESWQPYYLIRVAYHGEEVTLTYSRWDKKSKSYSKDTQESSYHLSELKEKLMEN